MSSVLHPVGPEPGERYWVRRVAVLVAAIVAIGVVIALVSNAMSAGSAVQAEPAPPTSLPPVVASTPTPSEAPTDGATATPSPTPGAVTPSSSPTASPTPSATESAAKKTEDKKAEKSEKKKVVEQPTYAACDGDDLRPTLTGKKTVKAKKKTTLSLSLINGGKKTCKVAVNAKKVTLTVVSGSDRIWSTADCTKAMPTSKRTLLPEHALTWKVEWSGTRSGKSCSTRKPAPKAGYYWAIASVKGAGDVRFRIILT